MYKNQLQELAQRSCFNLPSYSCVREGPDHAPRFKASVNFNGDTFDSPHFCTTLRQAEHSAAEVALHSLSSRAPSHSLAAKILDETGVYKNLLQEISQRVGARLPSYTTYRSGLGHLPVFTCTVELAGITFTGEPAKNKKQAEKNAAMAAWSALKKLAKQESSSSSSLSSSSDALESNEELEQITIARALLRYQLKEKIAMANNPDAAPFPKRFPVQPDKRPSAVHSSTITGSKILPLIRPLSAPKARPPPSHLHDMSPQCPENRTGLPAPRKFPAAGATPYVPLGQYSARIRSPYHDLAPPVSMRTAVPVFSAPPRRQFQPVPSTPVCIAQPVQIRQAVPVCTAAPRPATSITTPIQASVTKEEYKKKTMTVSPPHPRPTISDAPAESSAEKTPEQLAPPAAVTVSKPSSVNDAPLLAVSAEQHLQDGLEGSLKQQLNII